MKTRKHISYTKALYSRGFIAIVSLVLTLAFTSCSNDPILAAIEKEVELEDPSIEGTISSLVVVGSDIYAANGNIYRRSNGIGGWKNISIPSGASRCGMLATDGANLYGLFTGSDWTDFHSVQMYTGTGWTPVTGLSDVKQLGSGNGLIFAFTKVSSDRYNAYRTTGGAGSTTFSAAIGTSITLPVGCAGNASGSYFATRTGVYNSAGTLLSGGNAPSTELAGIAIGNNGDVYTANYDYAYRYSGGTWTRVETNLDSDPATGLAVLQTASKNLLLISCDEGYGEVSLDASGVMGTYFSPGDNSLSSTHPSDEDQYDSSIGNYNLYGIYAVTAPVPAGDDYVIYVAVQHYKYNGLWAYYDKSDTEWNRE